MNQSFKYFLFATLASTSSLITVHAFAATPAAGGGSDAGQIKVLADIDGILHATAKTAATLTYQADQFLHKIEGSSTVATQLSGTPISTQTQSGQSTTINMGQTGLSNYVPWQANANQTQVINNNLSSLPGSLAKSGSLTPNLNLSWLDSNNTSSGADQNTPSDILSELTTGTPAADSLYLSSNELQNVFACNASEGGNCTATLTQQQIDNIKQPTVEHNSYFNASTLLFPPNGAYTSSAEPAYSQNAAQAYITYLTENYTPLTAGVNLNVLKNLSGNQQALAVYNVKNSSAYQQYQMDVRNIVASRSLTNTLLNQLEVERTPTSTLGQWAAKANIPSQYYNAKQGTMSPLQLENYIAYHRVNNPQWYATMSTASPATVQRETLYVLAAILADLQQAHVDREKQLSLAILQAAQSTGGLEKLIQADANSVNSVISNQKGVPASSATSSQAQKEISGLLNKKQ